MKGTITWHNIEDAPKDGTHILIAYKWIYGEKQYGVANTWWNGDHWQHCKGLEITHFAYINPPEDDND